MLIFIYFNVDYFSWINIFNLIKMLGFKIKNKINQTKLVGFMRVEYQCHNLSHYIYIDKKHTKKEHAGGMFFLSFVRETGLRSRNACLEKDLGCLHRVRHLQHWYDLVPKG